MSNEIPNKRTYEQVLEQYLRQHKNPPRRCPKCGKGALRLLSIIESGQDGEIYERDYACSWCGKETHELRNPYADF